MLPVRALALSQVYEPVARKRGGRNAVELRAEQRVVLSRLGFDGDKEPILEEFRESLAPVVPHGRCLIADVAD